jgi:hypothetical protein
LENGLITLAPGMHLSDKGKKDSNSIAQSVAGICRDLKFDARAISACRAPEDPAGEVKP